MFVIAGITTGRFVGSCEVFDRNSNVFTKIKELDNSFYSYPTLALVSIGYKIIAFATLESTVYRPKTRVLFIYDVLKDQWSQEVTNIKEVKYCTKVPVV